MSVDYQNHSDGKGPVLIEHTLDDVSSISTAIIRSIAAIENVDPTELEITLYDYVHPEALDRLIDHEDSGRTEIVFAVHDYVVHVHDTGKITVRELN